jgi:hypothetical protein
MTDTISQRIRQLSSLWLDDPHEDVRNEVAALCEKAEARLEAELRMPEQLREIAERHEAVEAMLRTEPPFAKCACDNAHADRARLLQHLSTPVTPTPTREQITRKADHPEQELTGEFGSKSLHAP